MTPRKIAPTISKHLDTYYDTKMHDGQNSFRQYRHLIEEENTMGDAYRNFIGIYKQNLTKDYWDRFKNYFKLGLQASPHHIKELVERSSKYPEDNLAKTCQIT